MLRRNKFEKFVEFSVDKMHQMSQEYERVFKKSKVTGSIIDSKLSVYHSTGRFLDNSAAVTESVAGRTGTSIHHHIYSPSFTATGHSKKNIATNPHKRSASESWGTFASFCVPQFILVYVFYNEIKISALLNNKSLLLGHLI